MSKKSLLSLPIVLFLSPPLLAEGFYAGASIGMTQIEDEEQGLSFDDSAFGWRIHGGYEFNDNFAVEGAYFDSGEAEDTVSGQSVEVELTGFLVSLVGMIPVGGDNTRLFAKLGYYDGEAEASAGGITVEDDESGLSIGAGIRYDLANNFSLRGDFDWFDSDTDTLWSLGVGIQVLFGN